MADAPIRDPIPSPEIISVAPVAELQHDQYETQTPSTDHARPELLHGDAGMASLAFLSGWYNAVLEMRGKRALKRIEKFDHKDAFYGALGLVALAAVEGRPTDSITRVPPKNRLEKFMEDKTEHRLRELHRTRYAKKSAAGKGPTQTYGIRPAIAQRQRLREANQKYMNGELTRDELQLEKIRIQATPRTADRVSGNRPVAVKSSQQRRTSRAESLQTAYARNHTDRTAMPAVRNVRRNRAQRTVNKARRRGITI